FLDGWANANLPNGMTVDYGGESKEYRDNQGEMTLVFGLALLVVYLVLVAQPSRKSRASPKVRSGATSAVSAIAFWR
ncbi:hypothetical protein, partial [Aeromonas cavernicola]|uniref:hypothetical protein n=1 Tax=Aeromonas cavernicola TaxID=1006623 RepID=UPI001F236720